MKVTPVLHDEGRSSPYPSDLCDDDVGSQDPLGRLRVRVLEVAGLSDLFAVLADESRVKILYLLAFEELCVHQLARALDLTLPAVSHHLRLLKVMRLVSSRREGRHVYYRLADQHVLDLVRVAQSHYEEAQGPPRR